MNEWATVWSGASRYSVAFGTPNDNPFVELLFSTIKRLLSTPIGFWIVNKQLNTLIAIFLGTIRSICTPALIM